MATILPILLFVVVAAAVSCAMVAAPRLIAPRKRTAVKEMPYEAGMDPIHDTRRRFAVRFHLVAIAFLVFDVELLFLYPWAVAAGHSGEHAAGSGQTTVIDQESTFSGRPGTIAATVGLPAGAKQGHELARGVDLAVSEGWISSRGLVFSGAMAFILLVVVGFIYDWQKGIFQWR